MTAVYATYPATVMTYTGCRNRPAASRMNSFVAVFDKCAEEEPTRRSRLRPPVPIRSPPDPTRVSPSSVSSPVSPPPSDDDSPAPSVGTEDTEDTEDTDTPRMGMGCEAEQNITTGNIATDSSANAHRQPSLGDPPTMPPYMNPHATPSGMHR